MFTVENAVIFREKIYRISNNIVDSTNWVRRAMPEPAARTKKIMMDEDDTYFLFFRMILL